MDLEDPIEVALRMSEVLTEAGIDHALYGALLLAAYGEARETRDADLAVVNVNVHPVLAALESANIDAKQEFKDLRLGALVASRISLFGTPADPGLNNLDLLAPVAPRYSQLALERAVSTELRGKRIRVLTPEDYLLFKVLSSRDRDLADGASVLVRMKDELAQGYLDAELGLLASEVPSHPVADRWREMCQRASDMGA